MNPKRLSQAVSALFVVGLLLCTLWGNVAHATTYYANSMSGNDANPGTETLPVRTLSYGASLLSAGDTLLMRDGVYGGLNANDNTLTNLHGSSWIDAPVIAAYPGETVTLQPYGGEVLNLTKSYIQYVIFDGLTINATNTAFGISIHSGVHHIRFKNVEVKDAKDSGVLIGHGNQPSPFHSFIEFINCNVHHNGDSHFDHGFYISTGSNLVTQSLIHHNASFGVQAYSATQGIRVDNNVFSKNIVYNNAVVSPSGTGIFLSSGDGNMAYNNVVYGNVIGIGVRLNNPTNAKVFNNTIYKNVVGLEIDSSSTNTMVKNNFILWDSGAGIQDNGINTILGINPQIDLIHSGIDPKFKNAASFNFHLLAGSPAIDVGENLTEIQEDFDGLSRPQGGVSDIGAFEFPGGGGDPPPAAPTGLGASASGTTITLSWAANTESDLASYNVFMGTSPGTYGSGIAVGTVVSYQATGLNAGTTYYFALKAVDAGSNESGLSSEVSATTANGGNSFPPAMSSPAPGATLTSSTVTFVGGHTSVDVLHSLWVGTTAGANNLSLGGLPAHSRTVTGLPSSGTIYVRYWTTDNSNTSTGWVYTDQTYTMNVGGTTHQLTVNRVGSGTGTVTSAPTGISCGTTCTATYNMGTMVTLTASAASGSTFASWSGGGCSGSGTCSVTLTQAETVTATFNAAAAFPPLMSTPAPGAALTSSTVTFVGGHTSADVLHSLWVGTTAGANNLSSGGLPAHSRTVTGLPSSGTIYVRYWTTDNSNTSTGWVYTDQTYTMNVGGN